MLIRFSCAVTFPLRVVWGDSFCTLLYCVLHHALAHRWTDYPTRSRYYPSGIASSQTRNTPIVTPIDGRRTRIVEVFVGEYASGKTEVAINRALALRSEYGAVTLLDLDTEEPVYTVRSVKPILEERGLEVVALDPDAVFGLGEAGVPVTAEMLSVLGRTGSIVVDVGYGVHGAAALNLLEGIEEEPNVRVYCVVNARRPMTSTPELIAQYLRSLDWCHFIVNNTHLGDETTLEVILGGIRTVTRASEMTGIPVAAVSVAVDVAERLRLTEKDLGAPLWTMELFMRGSPRL